MNYKPQCLSQLAKRMIENGKTKWQNVSMPATTVYDSLNLKMQPWGIGWNDTKYSTRPVQYSTTSFLVSIKKTHGINKKTIKHYITITIEKEKHIMARNPKIKTKGKHPIHVWKLLQHAHIQ